jgi:hypothetical protein
MREAERSGEKAAKAKGLKEASLKVEDGGKKAR